MKTNLKVLIMASSVIASVILTTIAFADLPQGTALVGLNLQSTTEVSFTSSSVDWGTGSATAGGSGCTLETGTTPSGDCTGFTGSQNSLEIENIGSTDVDLELQSDKNADDLIGGTDPLFQWKMRNDKTDSCVYASGKDSYTDVSADETDMCTTFHALQNQNSVFVDLKVFIPTDASKIGAQAAVITAIAT